jgi:hypothetical protein
MLLLLWPSTEAFLFPPRAHIAGHLNPDLDLEAQAKPPQFI